MGCASFGRTGHPLYDAEMDAVVHAPKTSRRGGGGRRRCRRLERRGVGRREVNVDSLTPSFQCARLEAA